MTSFMPFSSALGHRRLWFKVMATASLAAGAWALSVGASVAQARDVYWSVGVNSPGVSLGVSNAPPVYARPPVVVYQQPPVVYQTAPTVIYTSPPAVVYRPHRPYPSRHVQPAVVVQGPVVVYPGWDDRRYRHDRRDWRDHKDRGYRHERRSRDAYEDRRGSGYR